MHIKYHFVGTPTTLFFPADQITTKKTWNSYECYRRFVAILLIASENLLLIYCQIELAMDFSI